MVEVVEVDVINVVVVVEVDDVVVFVVVDEEVVVVDVVVVKGFNTRLIDLYERNFFYTK